MSATDTQKVEYMIMRRAIVAWRFVEHPSSFRECWDSVYEEALGQPPGDDEQPWFTGGPLDISNLDVSDYVYQDLSDVAKQFVEDFWPAIPEFFRREYLYRFKIFDNDDSFNNYSVYFDSEGNQLSGSNHPDVDESMTKTFSYIVSQEHPMDRAILKAGLLS